MLLPSPIIPVLFIYFRTIHLAFGTTHLSLSLSRSWVTRVKQQNIEITLWPYYRERVKRLVKTCPTKPTVDTAMLVLQEISGISQLL